MNCRSAEDEIQKSLDGALTPGQRARLDAHVASCAACRRAWDEGHLLARAAGRWIRPRDDPGDAFTAQVLARIAARPTPTSVYQSFWLPLAATILLFALLAWLPGLLWPSVDTVGVAACQTPGWLVTNLRGLPADAFTVWGALMTGVPMPSWVWAALAAVVVVNAMFCVQTRQAHARRSLP
jgi:predicted anti-sigma-YlaC factor YlaD